MSGSDFRERLEEALALHRELPVAVGCFNFAFETFKESGGVQSDLRKLREAGIRNVVTAIGFGCYFQTGPRDYQLAGDDNWLLQKQLN
jgi:hypothetical protein